MLKILLRLLGRWRSHWKAVLISFGLAFGSLGTDTLKPLAVRYGIDHGIQTADNTNLLIAGALVLGLYSLRGIFAYGQNYASEFLSQHVAYDLRNDLYNRIQALSFSFHDQAQTGQLMARVTVDVETSRQFLSNSLLNLVTTFARFIVIAVIVLNLNAQLALCFILALPIVAFISAKTATALRPIWLRVQQEEGAYSAVLQETISGMRVVQSFTAEDREYESFQRANRAVRQNSLEANRLAAIRQPMLIFCMQALLVVILVYGGSLVIDGQLTVGTLLAFTQYSAQLTTPIRQLGALLNTSSRAVAAGERIFEILDTQSSIVDKPDAQPLTVIKGRVRYENVGFGYNNEVRVLHGVNIDAQPGQTVAVLGPVGSGKSTILNLLPRFYDVTEGRITIDGVDIRDVTLDSLRANVGIVMQDVFLFSGTIRENIAYGQPTATNEEIIEAAKVARIHDFIESLPEGYETWVGERGITLSGGQKQRVSIARTLLLNPSILVLDDSTSSVDMETEFLIQQALRDLLKGRTAFVIAHRLRTVRTADQIIVLEDGEIVEQGTHDSLIALGRIYREIYDLQLRDQETHEQEEGGGKTPMEKSL